MVNEMAQVMAFRRQGKTEKKAGVPILTLRA
jgi:hypothetical protein